MFSTAVSTKPPLILTSRSVCIQHLYMAGGTSISSSSCSINLHFPVDFVPMDFRSSLDQDLSEEVLDSFSFKQILATHLQLLMEAAT